MDDHQFHRLLAHFGFSRAGYRRVRKGVKKRLRRHMQELGCPDLAGYLQAIEASPRQRNECLRRLSVPISRFMRDGALWEVMAARLLPDLARRFGVPLAVWSAGCACGEEAYSLVISARAAGRALKADPPVLDILATDRNPAGLVRAREGIYPRSSLREMDAERRARHFSPLRGGRRYRIRPELRSGIHWLCCDITRLPTAKRFHGVLLRNNLLTYADRAGREQGLRRVIRHLRPGGFLVVGRRESLPAAVGGLVPRYDLPYVYERSVRQLD
jgi:chemotaxis methyl-accepting protein methylase